MASNPEQLTELQRKNMDAAMRLAQLSIENSQRIMQLQVETAKALFEDGAKNARALTEAKDPQQAMNLRAQFTQDTTEKLLACARQIAELTSQTQSEFGRMVTEQLSSGSKDMMEAMQKALSGMPIGSHNAGSAIQQAMDTARAAFEQVTKASTEAFSALSSMGTPSATPKRGTKSHDK